MPSPLPSEVSPGVGFSGRDVEGSPDDLETATSRAALLDLRGRRSGLVTLVGMGPGLRAAAERLQAAGWRLDCRDAASSRHAAWADRRGVCITSDDGDLPRECGAVVVSAAVDDSHPLRQQAASRGVPVVSYPELLAEWTHQQPSIAIAGTHGKSTTTSLLALLLPSAGLCVGADFLDGSPSGRLGAADLPLLVEACEYRGHCLGLRPTTLCILNIEHDHPDAFADARAVHATFRQFVEQLEPGGHVFREVSVSLPSSTAEPVTTFEAVTDVAARRAHVSLVGDAKRGWSLYVATDLVTSFTAPRLSPRLAPSLAAACAIALREGLAATEFEPRLASWPGLRCRDERRPAGPLLWWCDYAHHPTAIAATLHDVRGEVGDRRVIAVFEPHQASRLRTFFDDFADTLRTADEVVIGPVFHAREPVDETAARALTQDLAAAIGPHAVATGSWPETTAALRQRLGSPDEAAAGRYTQTAAVVLLGAGVVHGPELDVVRRHWAAVSPPSPPTGRSH